MYMGTEAWTSPTMPQITAPGRAWCTCFIPSWQVSRVGHSSRLRAPGKYVRAEWTECCVPAGYTPASQRGSINCSSEKYFFQESFGAPNHTKFSCKFTADMLQNCSGLVDPSFGFEDGKPCFIIKMNRVSGVSPGNLLCFFVPHLSCTHHADTSAHQPPQPGHCADCRVGTMGLAVPGASYSRAPAQVRS